MSLTKAYSAAHQTAAYFHYKNQLIKSDPLWVRNNLATSDQMEKFAQKVNKYIQNCRSNFFLQLKLYNQNKEPMTSVIDELLILETTLDNNMMTHRYCSIFREIVMGKSDDITSIISSTPTSQSSLSDELIQVENCLKDKDWVHKNLDSEKKKKFFIHSLFQFLNSNIEHLKAYNSYFDESVKPIMERIFIALPSNDLRVEFRQLLTNLSLRVQQERAKDIELKNFNDFMKKVEKPVSIGPVLVSVKKYI